MKMSMCRVGVFLAGGWICAMALPALAQDSNVLYSVDTLEQRLQSAPFQLLSLQGIRISFDPAKKAELLWPDSSSFRVKWKRAPTRGSEPNNEPRYEIGAYQFQKLFLDPDEYVVPVTVGRGMPLKEYARIDTVVWPTFHNSQAVFYFLQYWVQNVTDLDGVDQKRFGADPAYARHIGNMNILTYLLKHKDSNLGNFLISKDSANPRIFSVDNSLMLRAVYSQRGCFWKELRVRRLPAKAIERLRKLSEADLQSALGVVAQYEVRNDSLVTVRATENLNRHKGVRVTRTTVQLGLTNAEVADLYKRIRKLIAMVDRGEITTF
jgi:hypothetical protein